MSMSLQNTLTTLSVPYRYSTEKQALKKTRCECCGIRIGWGRIDDSRATYTEHGLARLGNRWICGHCCWEFRKHDGYVFAFRTRNERIQPLWYMYDYMQPNSDHQLHETTILTRNVGPFLKLLKTDGLPAAVEAFALSQLSLS